jgi:hypothetical protein
MNKFYIFLKTLIFSHYNVLALLFLVMFIAYTFNNGVSVYKEYANLNDNVYVNYSSLLFNFSIVLTGILLSFFVYHLVKCDNLPGFIFVTYVYCVIMIIVLLLMLVCQNEIRIMAGFGCLNTPLNGVFHYLRYEPSKNNKFINMDDVIINNW